MKGAHLLICVALQVVFLATSKASCPTENLEAVARALNSADDLWPGFKATTKFTAVYRTTGEVYVFDLQTTDPRWQLVSECSRPVYYSPQDHWDIIKAFSSLDFEIEGKKGIVAPLDISPKDSLAYRFFAFQNDHFQYRTDGKEVYFDYDNKENLWLILIENELLKISVDQSHSTDLAKDLVALRTYRYHELNALTKTFEKHHERQDGSMEYFIFRSLVEAWGRERADRELFKARRDEALGSQDLVSIIFRSRYYSSGALWGLVADSFVANWKDGFATEDVSAFERLAEKFNLSQADVEGRVARLKTDSRYALLQSTASLEAASYSGKVQFYTTEYAGMPGVSIEIPFMYEDCDVSYADGDNQIYLNDMTQIIRNLRTEMDCHPHARNFHVKIKPLPLGYLNFTFLFKEPRADISIDGKNISLADLSESEGDRTFTRLAWQGD